MALADTVFFLDRQIGRHRVAVALRRAGAFVVTHDEEFSQDTPDAVWITAITERGWVALTRDKRIARNPMERLAVFRAGARIFCFVSPRTDGATMAEAFVAALPAMIRFLGRHQGPFIAKVYRDGRVARWQDADTLGG